MKRFARSLLLTAGLVLASPLAVASADAGQGAKDARLLDAMVEMMPFGKVFDLLAAENPAWPFQDVRDKVDAGQVACVRGELSSEGYRRYLKPRVTTYAANHAARLDKELAVLEAGAAPLMGKLVIAGAEGERRGVDVDPEVVLADATPDQLNAFLAVFSDPEFAALRQLAGIGNAFDPAKSEAENEAAGEKMGGDLASRIMQRAMAQCDVDVASLE